LWLNFAKLFILWINSLWFLELNGDNVLLSDKYMEFLIKIRKQRSDLVIKTDEKELKKEIGSDRTFSNNLLSSIDELIKKAGFKNMPEFSVECDEGASMISCNVAKATAKALNI